MKQSPKQKQRNVSNPKPSRGRRSYAACLLSVLLLVFLIQTLVASAQTPETATIRGQVLDSAGGAVSGVNIDVSNDRTGVRRQATTDSNGFYSIAALPLTGQYDLTASKGGFADQHTSNLQLKAGVTAMVNITLKAGGGTSEVTVYGTTEGVRTDSPQISSRLDLTKIENTPILGRKLTNLPLLDSAVRTARGTGDLFLDATLFVVNGSGRRQTSFSIDGASGDDEWGRQTIFTNLPFSSLQEVTVLTNAFSAEYGRTTGSVVNVVTRSGTNSFHGDFLALWRPAGIQARSPLSLRRTADRLDQFSGSFSGPIIQDRTHFFVSGEYNRQDRDSTITSPLAPGLYQGHIRQGLFLAKVDHKINDSNYLTGRFNFDRLSDTNPQDAVGGNNLPSAARTFRRNTYTAAISENATINNRTVNEARFQASIAAPITEFTPVNPSIQYVRPGLATQGESRGALLNNHQYEVADTIAMAFGRHNLKVGVDAIHSTSGGNGEEFGNGFVLGQFTLNPGDLTPIANLTVADIQRFSQAFGNATYEVKEWLWSVFAQDDIKVSRDLTLNIGVRYERQTFTQDDNNVAPRIGLAYNILGDRKTVLRASYGIYYSEIPANFEAAANIDGPAGRFSFSAAPGQLGFPTNLQPLTSLPTGAVLPPRDINVLPGQAAFLSQFLNVSRLKGYPNALLNPYTQLASLGIEREIGKEWFLDVEYVHSRTIGIVRSIDLNSPAPFIRTFPGEIRSAAAADLTRPIVPTPNGYRRVIAQVNNGDAYYNALQVNLTKRFGDRFGLLLSYTYSHTIDTAEPDVPSGQDPNDENLTGINERASSLLDQRHRAALSGWYMFPGQVTFGSYVSLASGRPFNITTGVDNNGDGDNSDRPVINGAVIGRNTGQGTPLYDVSIFLQKDIKFGERNQVSLRAEGFNLFNHSNIVGRNGVYGNNANGLPLPTFGAAMGGISNVEPSREFQFVVRYRF